MMSSILPLASESQVSISVTATLKTPSLLLKSSIMFSFSWVFFRTSIRFSMASTWLFISFFLSRGSIT